MLSDYSAQTWLRLVLELSLPMHSLAEFTELYLLLRIPMKAALFEIVYVLVSSECHTVAFIQV